MRSAEVRKTRIEVRRASPRLAIQLLLCGGLWAPVALEAQALTEGRWPLQPGSRVERVIAPFLEGWYLNDDQTVTYSFGYLNLNDSTVEIPIGEGNLIEPARFGGMQPTVFLPGRRRGMFAVTVPASMRDDDVWWRITNPNGTVTEVPGTSSWAAYRLDWVPRPHGTVPPEVSFDGGEDPIGPGRGPAGVLAARTMTTSAGVPTALSVDVKEISVRLPDETDPTLLRGPATLRVVWTPYQGPVGAKVDFSRHPTTPEQPEDPDGARWGARCYSAVPCASLDEDQIILVPSGEGTVRVVATFSEPGDYVIHAQVDNWGLPDSTFQNQCCWTNGYVRVAVSP
ncbi:MAG TPA: hypothetical protein VLA09_05505 [Longimicrobiales bacterium]|nr:hypothetical protein [Longimicrobiales bacterium]